MSLGSIVRAPEVIVIGAGTFGAVLASLLDRPPNGLRVLLLESGFLERTEHIQNPPALDMTVPPPFLKPSGAEDTSNGGGWWRLPWCSDSPSHGLAYCVGGRSLFWGASCIWPTLDRDNTPHPWPTEVAQELNTRYLPAAAELLGLTQLWPHFTGQLNTLLRGRLLAAMSTHHLSGVETLDRHPEHPAAQATRQVNQIRRVRRAMDSNANHLALRLHLPMAIEVRGDTDDPQLLRFSSAAVLAEQLRDATGNLDLVPGCHVIRLWTKNGRVTAIETTRGLIAVPVRTLVVLAAGTIESTRLVLDATAGNPSAALVGVGLTTHLRSNLTVRLSLSAEGCKCPGGSGAAALQLRGIRREPRRPDIRFHHQITAYGVGSLPEEEAKRLWVNTPRTDVESLDHALRTNPRDLVVTVASAAEMSGDSESSVTLLDEHDEFGARRANVRLAPSAVDMRTWDALDDSADATVAVLASGHPYEVLRAGRFTATGGSTTTGPEERREPLGCGHHEMSTLRMGQDPRDSVTDSNGRIRALSNLYIVGPAIFPALDSAGPVLPGIALTLRLADHLRHAVSRGGKSHVRQANL